MSQGKGSLNAKQGNSPIIGELLGAARKKAPIKKASTDRE